MRTPILFPLVLAAAMAVPSPARAAQDAPGPEEITVRLQRPMKVGQRFNEITTANYVQTSLTRESKGVVDSRSSRHTIHFEADQEVLETTPRGSPKGYRLIFKEMTRQTEGEKKETIFKPGTVILGHAKADGSVFSREANGEDLEEDLQGTLADLFGMSDEDEATTLDDLYDNKKPRRIGDSWPINAAVARQWFQQPDDPRTIIGVTGESRLVRMVVIDGQLCYQVGHTVSLRQRSNLRWQRVRRQTENHFLSAMLSTLPADNTSMERGYRSMKRHRYINPDEDGPPGHSTEVIVESTYDTAIKPLPPAAPKPEAAGKPDAGNKPGAEGQPASGQPAPEKPPGGPSSLDEDDAKEEKTGGKDG